MRMSAPPPFMSNEDYTEGLGKKQVTRQKAQNKKRRNKR
jgi:hypothetical protein